MLDIIPQQFGMFFTLISQGLIRSTSMCNRVSACTFCDLSIYLHHTHTAVFSSPQPLPAQITANNTVTQARLVVHGRYIVLQAVCLPPEANGSGTTRDYSQQSLDAGHTLPDCVTYVCWYLAGSPHQGISPPGLSSFCSQSVVWPCGTRGC